MAPILRRLAAADIPVIRRDPVDPQARDVAGPIVEAVKERGMAAVREYAEKFGEVAPGDDLIIGRERLEQAWNSLDTPTQKTLVRTVHRVRRFAVSCPAPESARARARHARCALRSAVARSAWRTA